MIPHNMAQDSMANQNLKGQALERLVSNFKYKQPPVGNTTKLLKQLLSSRGAACSSGFCVLSVTGVVLLKTDSFHKLLGIMSKGDVRHISDEMPEHIFDAITRLELAALQSKQEQSLEIDNPLEADHPSSVKLTLTPCFDTKDNLSGYMLFASPTDILRQLQDELTLYETTYKRILLDAPISIAICEAYLSEEGAILDIVVKEWNAPAKKAGESLGVVLGGSTAHVIERFPGSSRFLAAVSRALRTGELLTYDSSDEFTGSAVRHFCHRIAENSFTLISIENTVQELNEMQILKLSDELRRLKRVHLKRSEQLVRDSDQFIHAIVERLESSVAALTDGATDCAADSKDKTLALIDEIQDLMDKASSYASTSLIPSKADLLSLNEIVDSMANLLEAVDPNITLTVAPFPKMMFSEGLLKKFILSLYTLVSESRCKASTTDYPGRQVSMLISPHTEFLDTKVLINVSGVPLSGLHPGIPPKTWTALSWDNSSDLDIAVACRLAALGGSELAIWLESEWDFKLSFSVNPPPIREL